MENNFSADQRVGGWFGDDSSVLHSSSPLAVAWFLTGPDWYLSMGLRLGTPVLKDS